MRTTTAIAASLALLLPFAWTGKELVHDLRARPTGREPGHVEGVTGDVPLCPGDALRVVLPWRRESYRALLVRPSAPAKPSRLTARMCFEGRCETYERIADAEGEMTFPMPAGVRGGMLELTILHDGSQPLVLHDRLGWPALELVRGYSWAPSLERAREMSQAMAGFSLAPLFVLEAVALVAILAAALWLSARGLRRPRTNLTGTPERLDRDAGGG